MILNLELVLISQERLERFCLSELNKLKSVLSIYRQPHHLKRNTNFALSKTHTHNLAVTVLSTFEAFI